MPFVLQFFTIGAGQPGVSFVIKAVHSAIGAGIRQHPTLLGLIVVEVIKMREHGVFFIFGTVIHVAHKRPALHQKNIVGTGRKRLRPVLFALGDPLCIKAKIQTGIHVLTEIKVQHVLIAATQHKIHPGKGRFCIVVFNLT